MFLKNYLDCILDAVKFVIMELERHLHKNVKMNDKGQFVRLFDSPRTLWEQCLLYFNWMDSNPMYASEQIKKPQASGVEGVPPEMLIDVPKKRPYTKKGLCIFLGVGDNFFRREDNKTEEYAEVFDMVDNVIFDQQYSGAAANFFNGQIVGKMLGLVEKVETKNKTEITEVFKVGDQEFTLE